MRITSYLIAAVALLLTLASPALADSIQLVASSSFSRPIDSPNDNFWGTYSTADGIVHPASLGVSATDTAYFPGVSLTIPTGDVVTSATITVSVMSSEITGTGFLFPVEAYAPPDQNSPSTAPTFSANGSVSVIGAYDPANPYLWPITKGTTVSTGDQNLIFDLYGFIDDETETPGVNWAGYLGGSGFVTVPYTVELDVTYSPVPEPSSIVLLGSGILGLAGIARRKIFRQS